MRPAEETKTEDLIKKGSAALDEAAGKTKELQKMTQEAVQKRSLEEIAESEKIFESLFSLGSRLQSFILTGLYKATNEPLLQQAEISVRKLAIDNLRQLNQSCSSALSAVLWCQGFCLHGLNYPIIMRSQGRFHAAAESLGAYKEKLGASTSMARALEQNPYLREVLKKKTDTEGQALKAKPVATEKKKGAVNTLETEAHETALKTHTIRNDAPLYVRYGDEDTALFEPKTVVTLRDDAYIAAHREIRAKMIHNASAYLKMSQAERLADIETRFEARPVEAADCKKNKCPAALIGQKGVFALEEIPAWSVIAFYSGVYIHNMEELNKIVARDGRENVYTYLYRYPNTDFPKISAFKYGSLITYVNSPTIYSGKVEDVAKELLTRTNVRTYYLRSGENDDPNIAGNPDAHDLICVFAMRNIRAGEQLFLDYGPEYWRNRVDNFIIPAKRDFERARKKLKPKKFF